MALDRGRLGTDGATGPDPTYSKGCDTALQLPRSGHRGLRAASSAGKALTVSVSSVPSLADIPQRASLVCIMWADSQLVAVEFRINR